MTPADTPSIRCFFSPSAPCTKAVKFLSVNPSPQGHLETTARNQSSHQLIGKGRHARNPHNHGPLYALMDQRRNLTFK